MSDTETITVNVSKEAAKKLRHMAVIKYGNKKGALGKAVSEAFVLFSKKNEESVDARLLKLMHKGFAMGKISGTRDDWHKR
ncbi:MAG: hypothetical protein BK997_01760 [Candidatus Micrarchaeum sp. ARMAN-1]|jgi:hypothetical protein|nr:MAG: hypothetical protein BK997_01760 [Candidatus Micrarchaeum sp. ARMAN-1]